jgi:hypothetical protein
MVEDDHVNVVAVQQVHQAAGQIQLAPVKPLAREPERQIQVAVRHGPTAR